MATMTNLQWVVLMLSIPLSPILAKILVDWGFRARQRNFDKRFAEEVKNHPHPGFIDYIAVLDEDGTITSQVHEHT